MVKGSSLGLLSGLLSVTLGALGASACGVTSPEPALELLSFRQLDFPAVALNEELLLHFSSELDRTSITSEALQVIDERGQAVQGERVVRGHTLIFRPQLPRNHDLLDGSFRPASAYRVVLGGFPRPDGIRSRSGALLSATLLLPFRTAEAGGEDPLFLPPTSEPHPLLPLGERGPQEVLFPEGRILLECGEALDPTTVSDGTFALYRYPSDSTDGEPEEIPLHLELAENRRERALLVLEPLLGPERVPGRLPPDGYYLGMVGRELKTLGKRSVEPSWPTLLPVRVPSNRIRVDFAATRSGRIDPLPGCAATAQRVDGRRLGVRFPAAAGSGEAGALRLSGPHGVADTAATQLTVPEGQELVLSGQQGPVVLRSQTSLEIRGRLVRRTAGRFSPDNPHSLLLRASLAGGPRDPLMAGGSGSPQFGEWLESLLRSAAPAHDVDQPSRPPRPTEQPGSAEPWTILIAGGDLIVPRGAQIDVDGALVLVAGGWIRVEGTVRAGAEVWKTAEGGGNISGPSLHNLPLVLEPPLLNPLRLPLRVGARSPPLDLPASAHLWRAVLDSSLPHGALLGELDSPARLAVDLLLGPDEERMGGDLVVPGGTRLRAGAWFEVQPGRGEAWQPPWLELGFEPVPEPRDVDPR